MESLPFPPLAKCAPTEGLCTCCSFLLNTLPQIFTWLTPLVHQGLCSKVNLQNTSLTKLSKITIYLCLIALLNFHHFLRHNIVHLFIHLWSVFCNTLWVLSSIRQCLVQSRQTEIIYKCGLALLSFDHSPPSLTTPYPLGSHFRRQDKKSCIFIIEEVKPSMLGQGPQPLPVKSISRFLAVYFLLCVLATQSFLSSMSISTTKSRQDDKSHSQDCLPHLWASSSFSPVSAQMYQQGL